MVQIEFENLGPIIQGHISSNNLMVFCGENNAGKTYASYVLYSLFEERFRTNINYFDKNELKNQGALEVDLEGFFKRYEEEQKAWVEEITRSLPDLFSAGINEFSLAKINFHTDIEEIKNKIFAAPFNHRITWDEKIASTMRKPFNSFKIEIKLSLSSEELDDGEFSYLVNSGMKKILDNLIFQAFYSEAFLLPAERAGLNLFYKELNASRNELLRKFRSETMGNESSIVELKKEISVYAKPISDYLTFLNRLSVYSRQEAGPFSDLAVGIQESILKGKYNLDDSGIQYVSGSTEEGEVKPFKIGLHTSSSTAKTLFGLVFYLTYMARQGATLIIDEPELNLHPDNQRKLARILAEATNRGLRVILSTHSDYIVKEFNNLIMLSGDFENREAIMEKFGYKQEQIIDLHHVSAYMFADGTISQMEVNRTEGIIAETFNEVINQYNASNDEIYYAIMENGHDEESD
ncbi:AAA family ATPase [Saccharibacillus sp. CPCC 101409]|uniref:AAA family ATPase n=1 Tax=Saccharibacillus sp. CPCC 101409 TaxID=3058041 RepID=UPI002671894C|nr:AAA family ATPase [Saccharibacillus sp. CPCC 101409]MDO3411602.1 AAA family ATPase [Saccharibacillus sp. CPCC 101409]